VKPPAILRSNPEASATLRSLRGAMTRSSTRPAGVTKGTMTRILLADDQQVVRQGLRCLLERETDLQVVPRR